MKLRYKRTYKGLYRKHLARITALKYPNFKKGDTVVLVDNILEIDARITGAREGYTGRQVLRRNRFSYLSYHSIRGKIIDVRFCDIYVKWEVKDDFYKKKYAFDQPMILRKQMIRFP